MKKFLSLMTAALLGGLISVYVFQKFFLKSDILKGGASSSLVLDQPPATLAKYMTQLPTSLPDFTLVAEMTVNAVVHIRTEYEQKSTVYDDFFGMPDEFRDFFFGPRQRSPQRPIEASGSGVIISSDGYIVTNNHVVTESDRIEVTLNDNRIYEAKIVGLDPTTDLALIKIEENNLPFLEFGDSDEVRVGEWVLAVGNPFNLTSTVTAGIVSAKGRNIRILGGDTAIEAFIQTDAAVNRGNSGGALVNTHGELIGINAAIASNTGSYTGYSFAIPSNIARKVMDDLKEHGEVQRGFLGVRIRELNSREASDMGLDMHRGAYVDEVVEGGAAEMAGIKQGDLIVSIDGQTIQNPSELIEATGRKRPGDKVNVSYYRNGKERSASATLKNIYGETSLVKREDGIAIDKLGARFAEASREELSKLGIDGGVKVVEVMPGKLFADAGIREGFIIIRIDRESISSPQELNRIMQDKKGGVLIEGIYPNGRRAYYGIGI